MPRLIQAALLAVMAVVIALPDLGRAQARPEACTREAFAKVVDESGAALRRYSAASQPRLQAGFRRLKQKRGWSEEEHLDKANALLADAKGEAFDQTTGELLAKLDRLGAQDASADCARLTELEATALELQATVKAKTEYMLAKLDALAEEPAQTKPDGPAPPPGPVAKAQPPGGPAQHPASPGATSRATPPPQAALERAPAQPPAAKAPPRPSAAPWSTTTTQDPPPPATPQMPVLLPAEEGYTIDEIREASRGFFGSLSTGLAGVIEHAFAKAGRPKAYVLGEEGGGAFLAGLRYGSGTLYPRNGGPHKVYWHGPSIGYDFGASGSKTLFLVYGLKEVIDIYSGFSGVDGSAYLVGGVGMTLLTDGKLVLAPIRSGLGLRIGASIGYIRFTPRPTWNPF